MSFIDQNIINSLYQFCSYFRNNDISVYDGQLSTLGVNSNIVSGNRPLFFPRQPECTFGCIIQSVDI